MHLTGTKFSPLKPFISWWLHPNFVSSRRGLKTLRRAKDLYFIRILVVNKINCETHQITYRVHVAMATGGESSRDCTSEDTACDLPEPPEKPQDSDCCGTGCVACVFDIYEEEMVKWRIQCEKIKNGENLDNAQHLGNSIEVLSSTEFRCFALESIIRLTANSCLYRFRIPGNQRLGLQIGQHLIMRYGYACFFAVKSSCSLTSRFHLPHVCTVPS